MKTIGNEVITKSTFDNTFDYFGRKKEVGDWTVIWKLIVVYSSFLEKWEITNSLRIELT